MAPSIWQILIIVLVVLFLFGAGRVPRIMEDMAKGIKSFKKGMKEEDEKTGGKPSLSHAKNDDDVIDAESADSKKSTSKKK